MRIRIPWLSKDDFPTLIHFTHAKAGSTWIDGILTELFKSRIKPRSWQGPDFSSPRASVYPSVFMTRDEFLQIPQLADARRFVVIRDLRDTLVSGYFSLRSKHDLDPGGAIQRVRERLQNLSVEDGLIAMLDEKVSLRGAAIQRSWIGSGERLFRYEELLANDESIFTDLLVRRLGLPISEEKVAKAVRAHRFERVFQRKLGEVNEGSHGRQGAPGDWRNHFTSQVRREFHARYGDVLIAAGYEPDASWAAG